LPAWAPPFGAGTPLAFFGQAPRFPPSHPRENKINKNLRPGPPGFCSPCFFRFDVPVSGRPELSPVAPPGPPPGPPGLQNRKTRPLNKKTFRPRPWAAGRVWKKKAPGDEPPHPLLGKPQPGSRPSRGPYVDCIACRFFFFFFLTPCFPLKPDSRLPSQTSTTNPRCCGFFVFRPSPKRALFWF